MGYHIFLAKEDNFNICIQRGVYGGIQSYGSTKSEQLNSEIISSFEAIKADDYIFFYVKNIGIYGLWKAIAGSFYDENPIWNTSNQIYPYRVCFEPAIRKFSNPIEISDILDLKDKGRIWTFDLGAITRKSHHPITTDEGKEIIRLLLRNNPIANAPGSISQPYLPLQKIPLPFSLETGRDGHLKYEGFLNAWFMRSFAHGGLKEVIGEYRDYLNYVPTSFNKVMDIFLTHVTTLDNVDILHKYTCMELKTGVVNEEALKQIIKYGNWLTRKLASGDEAMVQNILVGYDFDDKLLDYWRRRGVIEDKKVRLLKYRVNNQNNDLILQEVND